VSPHAEQQHISERTAIAAAFSSPFLYGLFAVSCLLCWMNFSHNMTMVGLACVFAAGLCLSTVVDLKYMILPDSITLPLLITGLFLPQLLFGQSWILTWLGAVAGFTIFGGISWGFYKMRGYPGMGFGDIKFLAMLGAWVNIMNLPLVLLLAAFSALPVFMGHKMIFKTTEPTPVPFGPFLAFGGLISFLYADTLWSFIIHLRAAFLGLH
jgi:prepilin signal peptidase PulO-like enzyme (type II secretory pathway)